VNIAKTAIFKFYSTVLVLISLLFLGYQLTNSRTFLLSYDWDHTTVIVVLCCSVCYMLCCSFLAVAWRKLLETFGSITLTDRFCHYIYARTQVAKYIPGNVFQIAGRHALGRKLGLNHETLAYAAFYEIAGVASVASLLSISGILLTQTTELSLTVFQALIFLSVTASLGLIFIKALPWAANRLGKDVRQLDFKDVMPRLVSIFTLYLWFFSCCGLILFTLIFFLTGLSGWSIALLSIATFSISWLSGFITPGSPSGLGVREAVLVLILGGVIGKGDSLVIAFFLRVVTILGDLLFFTLATSLLDPPTPIEM